MKPVTSQGVVSYYSSGILITHLLYFLELLYDAVIWFKLDEFFFNYKHDVYFAFTYIAPVNSVFYNYFDGGIFVDVQLYDKGGSDSSLWF